MKKLLSLLLAFIIMFSMAVPVYAEFAQPNVLRVDIPPSEPGSGMVMGSSIARTSVRSVTFVDSLENAPANAWDASEARDNSVLVWVEPNGDWYDLYFGAEGGVIANKDSACLFWDYQNLEEIHFNGHFDTSGAESMYGMFVNCLSLNPVLDLRGLNTHNVTDMQFMFYNCPTLETIAVDPDFHVPPSPGSDEMFTYSSAQLDYDYKEPPSNILRSDVLSEDDENNLRGTVLGSDIARTEIATVTFTDTLAGAPDSAWDVSAVGDGSVLAWVESNGSLYDLFIGAEGVVHAYEQSSHLFANYVNLTDIHFGGALDTSPIISMRGMFKECSALTHLDLSSFITANAIDMADLFSGCSSLTGIVVGEGFVTYPDTDVSGMFTGCGVQGVTDPAESRVLRSDLISQEDIANGTGMVLGANLPRSSISSVSFLSSRAGAPADAWDVSQDCDGSVLAWVVPDGELYQLFIAANGGVIAHENSSFLFANYTNLHSVHFGGALDTSSVSTMYSMFYRCSALTDLDFGWLDTSSVTNMSYMFCNCSSLPGIDLSRIRTAAVTDMSYMFNECASLTDLDLSAFDTGSVQRMSGMFRGCEALRTLDLSAFDTLSVQYMDYMFCESANLSEINFSSSFRTDNVLDMSCMFYSCSSLQEPDLSGWDTSLVKTMYGMFMGCESLTHLNLDSFNTVNTEDMSYMFSDCPSLTSLNLTGFDTYSAHKLSGMFQNCSSLTEILLGDSFMAARADNLSGMFMGCASLTGLDLCFFDTANVQDMSRMFEDCYALTQILVGPGFVIGEGVNTENMLLNCAAQELTYPYESRVMRSDLLTDEERYETGGMVLGSDIPRSAIATVTFLDSRANAPQDAWDVSRDGDGSVVAWVTPAGDLYDLFIAANGVITIDDCNDLFATYTNATSIRLGGVLDTSGVGDMTTMFFTCPNLREVDAETLDTSGVIYMNGMFEDCQQLESLNLSGWNTSSLEEMQWMFSLCRSLQTLDLSAFDTANVTDMSSMFEGCSALTQILVSDRFVIREDANTQSMFMNCGTTHLTNHNESRVLRNFPISQEEIDNGGGTVLGSDIPRSAIATVTFLDSRANAPQDAWDVSQAGDGSVLAWIVPKGNRWALNCYDLFIAANGTVIAPEDCSHLFTNYQGLVSVNFRGVFDTSLVRYADGMFQNCSALTDLNLQTFDTRSLESMAGMFYFCTELTQLTFGDAFCTDSVQNMGNVFEGCRSLRAVDLSRWNTSLVSNMNGMFAYCEQLTRLNLSSFDTANVMDMGWMFEDCYSLTQILVSDRFVIREDSQHENMFFDCNLSGFYNPDDSSAGNRILRSDLLNREDRYRFRGMVLGSDIPREAIATVTFVDSLEHAPDSAWDVSRNRNGSVLAWATENGGLYDLFIGADGGVIANEDCSSLFANYTSLNAIHFGDAFDVSTACDMTYMFHHCTSLTGLDLSRFNTASATDMYCMFSGCTSLTGLDLTSFSTSAVSSMSFMFDQCSALTGLDLSGLDTSSVVTMHGMFSGCSALTELDLTSFNTGNVQYMGLMFAGCSRMERIHAGDQFVIRDDTETLDMFIDCGVSGFNSERQPAGNRILRSDPSPSGGTVLGSDIPREAIATVTFVHSLEHAPDNAWDVSRDNDGSVLAWVTENGDLYDLFIGANGNILANEDCSYLFAGYTNLTALQFDYLFHTAGAVTMKGMFSMCESLPVLDLSTFETGNTIDMSNMFTRCSSLNELILTEQFDTRRVADMNSMFATCSSLTELNLSSFSSESVENMDYMFLNCINLTSIHLTDRFVPREDAVSMFKGCPAQGIAGAGANDGQPSNLLADDPSPSADMVWDTGIPRDEVITITFLDSLENAPADAWDVSQYGDGSVRAWVTPSNGLHNLFIAADGRVVAPANSSYLFSGYVHLADVRFNGLLDTSGVVSMKGMFSRCESLTGLRLNGFETHNVADMSYMFIRCESLRELDFSDGFDTSSVTTMNSMFAGCVSLKELDLNAFNTGCVEDMSYMFMSNGEMDVLDVSSFNTSNVRSMRSMFADCDSLVTLRLDNFDTSNVADMSNMFETCDSLAVLDLSSFQTANVQNMSGMFRACQSLIILNVDHFNTSRVADMSMMFANCHSLNELNLSSFDTSGVTPGGYTACLKDLDGEARIIAKDGAILENVLYVGSRGELVQKIQQNLIDLGFLHGSADGVYGNQTDSAVNAAMEELGFTPDMLQADELAYRDLLFALLSRGQEGGDAY